MASTSNLVAFIIGAGSHIGASLAATLRQKGYSVALGSRNIPAERSSEYFYVKVDASKREEVESAFDIVVNKLGPVNVVVYNAAGVAFPPTPNDILSLPVDSYYDAATLGIGAFVAAQKAVASFKNPVHRDHPKVFIATGNILPFSQYTKPEWFTLGIQKALEARFVATAAQSYKDDDIKFYFATLVSQAGGIPKPGDFEKSAATHAEYYWRLISDKATVDWDQKFTLDGKPYIASTQ